VRRSTRWSANILTGILGLTLALSGCSSPAADPKAAPEPSLPPTARAADYISMFDTFTATMLGKYNALERLDALEDLKGGLDGRFDVVDSVVRNEKVQAVCVTRDGSPLRLSLDTTDHSISIDDTKCFSDVADVAINYAGVNRGSVTDTDFNGAGDVVDHLKKFVKEHPSAPAGN
jgi:hypothetical protein